MQNIDEHTIRAKLARRPGRGGVRLTSEEAAWMLDYLDHSVDKIDRETLRCLIDQAKRKRLMGTLHASPAPGHHNKGRTKVAPPVIDLPLNDSDRTDYMAELDITSRAA